MENYYYDIMIFIIEKTVNYVKKLHLFFTPILSMMIRNCYFAMFLSYFDKTNQN